MFIRITNPFLCVVFYKKRRLVLHFVSRNYQPKPRSTIHLSQNEGRESVRQELSKTQAALQTALVSVAAPLLTGKMSKHEPLLV